MSAATVAGWLIACFLASGVGTLLQAQAPPAGFTVTGAFASTVDLTFDSVAYKMAVDKATAGTLKV